MNLIPHTGMFVIEFNCDHLPHLVNPLRHTHLVLGRLRMCSRVSVPPIFLESTPLLVAILSEWYESFQFLAWPHDFRLEGREYMYLD